MTKVNLLPNKARLGMAKLVFLRRLRLAAIISLAVFVVWAAAVLLAAVLLASKEKKDQLVKLSYQRRLAEFAPKLNLQIVAREKIKSIAKIMSEQEGLVFKISDLRPLIGSEAKIRSFNYKKGEITAVVDQPGLVSLADFEKRVDRLNQQSQGVKYKLIDVRSIAVNGRGLVKINLKIIVDGHKVK